MNNMLSSLKNGIYLNKEKDINTEVYLGLWDDIGTPERLNAARKTISL